LAVVHGDDDFEYHSYSPNYPNNANKSYEAPDLTDFEPYGKAIALCEGIVRSRFRNGTYNPEIMTPGEIYEFEIDMWNPSNMFKKGNCIRIEISSSNFPRYNRNFNSVNPIATETEIPVANQKIYDDPQNP
jgi:putative CocE/NonD family hydrolase